MEDGKTEDRGGTEMPKGMGDNEERGERRGREEGGLGGYWKGNGERGEGARER